MTQPSFLCERIRRPLRFGLFLLFFALSAASAQAAGTLPGDIQKGVDALLAMQDPKAPLPSKALLNTFLEYTTSPVNLTGVGEKPPFPDKYEKGSGVLWRSRLRGVTLATTLQYLFNPKVPMTVVYPASIRYAAWQPGSGILDLKTPLWDQLGQHATEPLVLRGTELEEITPDDNSGSYYKYLLDRVLILTQVEGKNALISISWQRGKSEVGKKAVTLGDYSDWDFVYSGVKGTMASGIGWAETFIYSSASIIVFYEDVPGGTDTGYAMYRWMDAGWSSMNMVKQSHIIAGAERSFAGLKSFMESPKRPTPDAIAAYMDSLNALDLAQLRERFAPYGAKVEELSAKGGPLASDDFRPVLKDGKYGDSMTREELIAAFAVNYIKECLGKPLLAGPLYAPKAAKAETGAKKAKGK